MHIQKKSLATTLSDSLSSEGTIWALKMSIKQRQYKNESLIHHSDRGIQYYSDEYQRLLIKHKIRTSMTESYDPYANAIAERVNGILKSEFQLESYHVDRPIMKQLINETINIYNSKRPHYSCFMLTPNQMHYQNKVKIRTYRKINTRKASLSGIN